MLVRAQVLGRLLAGIGGPAHVNLLLEAQQLRQVVARLRDVVDDQDLDHGLPLGLWIAELLG